MSNGVTLCLPSSVLQTLRKVKQGGILPPKLFNVHMDNLSSSLKDLNIGGKIGGRHLNHLFYADDVCLISLSTAGMQKLLNVCQDYALSHDLLFNSKTSMCMKFVTKSRMKTFPPMTLMGSEISFVDQCKYLGTIIDVKKLGLRYETPNEKVIC